MGNRTSELTEKDIGEGMLEICSLGFGEMLTCFVFLVWDYY